MGIFDSYNKHFNPFNLVNKLNPSKDVDKYLRDIPGMGHDIYDPFINAGKGQLPGLEDAYKNMMTDPGGFINKIGQGYQKSPGFDFALKQALGASGNAAAAGGMAGSPQHEMENMQLATDLGNQDFNQWIEKALGQYNRGLSGSENMYSGGRSSADALARMLAENSKDRAANAGAGKDWLSNLLLGGAGAGIKYAMM